MLKEPVTEETIINAYRYILGREPENDQVVKQKLASCATFEAVRNDFLDSFEFRAKLGLSETSQPASKKPSHIDLDVSEEDIRKLVTNVEEVWKRLGEDEPWWSVVSERQFHGAMLEEDVKNKFYNSGQATMQDVLSALNQHAPDLNPENVNCLEFGCGVARNLIHAARHFRHVTGVDISMPHLNLAAKEIKARSIANTSLAKISKLDSLSKLDKFGVIFTFIALQHNPPPIIVRLLHNLFNLLEPGGIIIFQVPIAAVGYSFDLQNYLQNIKPENGMEMHALPIHAIFKVAKEQGCAIVDARTDSYCEYPNMISHTFISLKEASN